MDDIKLRSFLAVVDTGSINKAAELLDIAPVSVKRQLDAIEAEVDSALLIRTPHGTMLTESGKHYYDFAKETLDQFSLLKKRISRLSFPSKQLLTICSSSNYSSVDLESLSVAFMKRYPLSSVMLLPSDRITWVEKVLTGKADCASCNEGYFDSLKNDKLLYHPVLKTNYVAVMSHAHPLSTQKQLSMEQLSNEKLFFNYHLLNQFHTLTQQHEIRTEHINLSPSSSQVFNICMEGSIFISLNPLHTQYSSLASVNINIPPLGCGFITKKNMSKTLQDFIHFSQQLEISRSVT